MLKTRAGDIIGTGGLRLMRRRAVEEMTGLSRSSIYKMMDEGVFPAQVHLGPMTVAWVEAEILAWIEARIAARDRTPQQEHAEATP